MNNSNKKLLIFWIIAAIFLCSWSFYFLKIRNSQTIQETKSLSDRVGEARTVYDVWNKISQKDDREKSFLILFQNNMELRPSGGYAGTFGILKIKNGEIVSFESHNTNVFDGRVPDGTPTPFPMTELLKVKDWKMRDANWFPDWKDSALQAESFYHEGQGQEKFDGIIAINASFLSDILSITGPVMLPNSNEEFTSENAILKLEYFVEKGYKELGLKHGERKSTVQSLGQAILEEIKKTSISKKIEFLKVAENALLKKDIQLYFKDESLQKEISAMKWDGRVDSDWKEDYLMVVDANLGALKSNRLMDYSLEYRVDLSKEKPESVATIRITHNGKEKDWLTKDYQGFLRVYAPKEAWLLNLNELPKVKFSQEYEKKVFGIIDKVPLGQTAKYKFDYSLPERFRREPYKLLIQKQSGIGTIPAKIIIIDPVGKEHAFNLNLEKDEIIEL